MLLACLPPAGPDLADGPVLLSEPRLLVVPAGHPPARRGSVPVEDLARAEVLPSPLAVRREGGQAPQPGGTRAGAGGGSGVSEVQRARRRQRA